MPDLVPEDRIEVKKRYVRDLQPGESVKVHPVAFSVTPERHLAILKNLELDGPAFRLGSKGACRIGREADGTWCADLRDSDKAFRFESISRKEMDSGEEFYVIIDKLLW
jgi:hypothetical protein